MSFLGNSKELLLAYSGMKNQTLSHSVNIMLTPQFYTLKKEKLPLKYLYQAKKIASSLFDGFLDEQKNYEYFVYKQRDEWIFIAYNPKEINAFFLEKGIKPEQVGKIFFVQQDVDAFTSPVMFGENELLVSLNGIVTIIPKVAIKDSSKILVFDNSFTPKRGVTLQGVHDSILSNNQTIGLVSFFILFAFMFFAEGWRYSHDSKQIEEEMQTLLIQHPSLQSKYTRDSISAKYNLIDKNERKKREVVNTLAGMIFKGVKLKSFKMNEKMFEVDFICSDAKVAKRLILSAKTSSFLSAKILTNNIVNIEEKL